MSINSLIQNKKLLSIVVGVVVLSFASWLSVRSNYQSSSEEPTQPNVTNEAENIKSYEECVEAGYPVMESYPEQCAVPGGESFVRDIIDDVEEPEPEPEPQSPDNQQAPTTPVKPVVVKEDIDRFVWYEADDTLGYYAAVELLSEQIGTCTISFTIANIEVTKSAEVVNSKTCETIFQKDLFPGDYFYTLSASFTSTDGLYVANPFFLDWDIDGCSTHSEYGYIECSYDYDYLPSGE